MKKSVGELVFHNLGDWLILLKSKSNKWKKTVCNSVNKCFLYVTSIF